MLVCVHPPHCESTDYDEVGLLQPQGTLPVDHHDAHDTKVPYAEGPGDPVQGQVVHHADVPAIGWGRRGGTITEGPAQRQGAGLELVVWCGCSQEVEGGKEEQEQHRHHQQPDIDNL